MPDEPAAGNDHAVTFPKIELHVHLEGTVRADASGELTGPTVYSASPGLDASPPAWPETQLVEDPAFADGVVAAQVAAGWRFIKVYNNLSLPVYDALYAWCGKEVAGR